MAQLPMRFINLNDVQSRLFELENENKLLKQRINEMQHVIDDITNISNGGNNGEQESKEQDAKQTCKGQSSVSKKRRMAKLQKAEDA